jgi:hypothetical protein
MNIIRISFYFFAPAALLLAGCQSSFDQGEVKHHFRRDSSPRLITDEETVYDIPLYGIDPLDDPKVKEIKKNQPDPVRHWPNDNIYVVGTTGNPTPTPSKSSQKKTTAEAATNSTPKTGYIYYRLWYPILKQSESGYPGKLDQCWLNGTKPDNDSKGRHPLESTLVIAGTLRFMKSEPETVKIKARLFDPKNNNPWWIWKGIWKGKQEERGVITWTDGPAN